MLLPGEGNVQLCLNVIMSLWFQSRQSWALESGLILSTRVNPSTCCSGTACDSALAFSQCILMAADCILFGDGKKLPPLCSWTISSIWRRFLDPPLRDKNKTVCLCLNFSTEHGKDRPSDADEESPESYRDAVAEFGVLLQLALPR